jgi:hypothetical protein
VDALLRCVKEFKAADLPFMVVGALAVSVHGEPRTTGDIDLAVRLDFDERGRVEDALRSLTDEPIEERKDRMGHRLVTDLPSGLMVEVFFVYGHPLYDREYERRVVVEIRDVPTPLISPEDLILRKLVNTRIRRGHDLKDAFGVAETQGERLDIGYLREHCAAHRVCDYVDEIEELIGTG